MKKMNRKKIIDELESLRNMCANAMMNARVDNKIWLEKAYQAHHNSAVKLIVELGGESTKEMNDEIVKLWNEYDKNIKTENIKLDDIKEYVAEELGYTNEKNGDRISRQYGGSDDDIIELIYKKYLNGKF